MPISSIPLLRKFEINQDSITRVNAGRIAVNSEVLLQDIFMYRETDGRKEPLSSEELHYQGVVDINHTDLPEAKQDIEEPEIKASQVEEPSVMEQQPEERLETVSNKYIPSKPYEPTGNEPYPENPALLAPS